jgi:TRAP-type C4-dicarboxylate transport system permease small subunit
VKPVSQRYSRLRGRVLLVWQWPLIVLFITLVMVVLYGVFMRKFFAQPGWTEELSNSLLIWVSMLGAPLGYAHRAHLGIDVLRQRLDPGAQRALGVIGHGLVLAFALWVMVLGGQDVFAKTMETGQVVPAMQFRKGWVYLVTPISGAAFVLLAAEGITLGMLGRRLDVERKAQESVDTSVSAAE